MLARRSTGALLILLLALAPACRRGSRGEAGDAVAQQEAATGVEAFFRYGPLPLGSSRASVRAALGEPDSITVRTVANRHDASVTDSVFLLHYAGLRAEIYRVTYDGKELLSSVRVTDDRYLRPESPLRLRMARDELLVVLGPPDREDEGDLFYSCGSCSVAGYDRLELRLERDTLRAILLQYWID